MTDTQPGGAVSTPPAALDLRTMYPDAPEVTLIDKLGIVFTEISAERTAGRMPVEGNTQPAGLLHGGASAALAETLGSVAAQVHAGADRRTVGIDLNATHHRGARSGTVTAVATAIHLGRTMAAYEVVVEDETNRRVCTARLTCLILDG
ncbi:hotdog fold thioesterase [Myceligenerans cantabricum]